MNDFPTAKLKQIIEKFFPKGPPEQYLGRRYDTPNGYISTKMVGSCYAVAGAAYQGLYETHRVIPVGQGAYGAIMARYLDYHDWQYYWLGREIGRALLDTDVPREVVVRDVPLPFNAFTILLPKGLFTTPKDGDMAWLSVASIDKDDDNRITTYDGNTRRSLMVWGMSFPEDGRDGVDWDATTPQHMTVGQFLKDTTYQYRNPDGEDHPDSRNVPAKMLSLALNVCFYLAQDPKVVESQRVNGKGHEAGKPKKFLTPRWVGRRYRYPEPTQDGTHASPRAHWRRGHWRGVRFGEGRKELKRVWIEPTLVNAVEAG